MDMGFYYVRKSNVITIQVWEIPGAKCVLFDIVLLVCGVHNHLEFFISQIDPEGLFLFFLEKMK